MIIIINYLIIGSLWTLFLDLLAKFQKLELQISTYERIFSMLIWPLGVIIFGYEFIKSLINNNNDEL